MVKEFGIFNTRTVKISLPPEPFFTNTVTSMAVFFHLVIAACPHSFLRKIPDKRE